MPLHISGFWVPHITDDPLTTGSLGAGITLRPWVEAHVAGNGKDEVLVGSNMLHHGLIECVKNLTGVNLINAKITTPAYLGEGLGFSAALSISLASSALLGSGRDLTLARAGVIAHEAEVTMMTGLGDVVAELRGGGLVVRVKPGAPGVGEVDVCPIRDSINLVACLIRRDLTTPLMLKTYGSKIREVGGNVFRRFLKEPSFDRFLELTREFSKSIFLPSELDSTLMDRLGKYLRSGEVLTYFVKKGTLAVITSRRPSEELLESIKGLGIRLVGVFEPSLEGTAMLI